MDGVLGNPWDRPAFMAQGKPPFFPDHTSQVNWEYKCARTTA